MTRLTGLAVLLAAVALAGCTHTAAPVRRTAPPVSPSPAGDPARQACVLAGQVNPGDPTGDPATLTRIATLLGGAGDATLRGDGQTLAAKLTAWQATGDTLARIDVSNAVLAIDRDCPAAGY